MNTIEHENEIKLIEIFTEEKVRRILNLEFPNLKVDSIKLVTNGWDNYVAEINREYIFRFPKGNEYDLNTEINIFIFLNNKISLQIPKIEFIGKHVKCVGYTKIEGEELMDNYYLNLNNEEKNNLAKQISIFLFEMHANFTIEHAAKIGIEKFDKEYEFKDLQMIRNTLLQLNFDSYILNKIEMVLEKWEKYNRKAGDKVVLLGDLHMGNMAFNKVQNVFSCIFDFSNVKTFALKRFLYSICYLINGRKIIILNGC